MECCKTKEDKGCCDSLEKQGIKNMKTEKDSQDNKQKKKGIWFFAVGAIFAILLILLFTRSSSASSFENINKVSQIDIYKSITCGCCDVYSSYVDGKISAKVNVVDIQDSKKIKEQYGVPSELQSCHTSIVGNYFVEGHVPLEAVEKLLKEQLDIKGIAMPGMPMGSPGMPGSKNGDFVIYAVHNDGNYSEFMRI